MGTAHRPPGADLTLSPELRALLEEPGPWRFTALVRLLQSLLPDTVPVGGDGPPEREAARFQGHASLGFPPRDIVSVRAGQHLPDGAARFDVQAAFFGLYGPASPLPEHDTWAILRDFEHGDRVAAFLDVFNHRALSLLYRAWAAGRWWVEAGRWGEDRFTRQVDELLALPEALEAAGLSKVELLGLAGLWHHHPRGASGLEHVLRRCLPHVQLRVDTALLRAVDLPDSARQPLGSCRLGHDTLIGRRVWTLGGAFRVSVGPLSAREAEDFRASGPQLRRLRALVDAWCDGPVGWDLELLVEDAAIPTARLSSRQPSTRLGRDAMLGRPRTATVRLILTPNSDGGFDGAL